MAKRNRRKFWKPEIIIITVFVICFFIWAIAKLGLGTMMSDWFADDSTEDQIVATVDTLQTKLDELRPIYVTIDNLNMRTEPTLKSSVLKKLPLHERVYFTGIMSDSTMRINIGRVIADEPWVKIIHEDGTEGWLYGAGVQFYRTSNPNAISN